MVFSTGFMRAFGYYDGMLFEVRSLELGYDRPVAAGGRYDSLPVRLGSRERAGAIGCTVRPGRGRCGGLRMMPVGRAAPLSRTGRAV